MSEQPPAQSELRSQLSRDSKKKRNIIIAVIVVVVLAVAAILVGVFVNKNGGDSAEGDRQSVRIAISSDANWYDVATEVAAEKGLDIEWVTTDDWILPNTELVAGSVDANAFQHILYLSAFNAQEDANIVPVFSTHIVQWGIFSDKYESIEDFPDGAKIVIPDDLSNGARALYILEAAGLIEIDDNAGLFPTTEDITSNPHNLEISGVVAQSISQLYTDPAVTAAIIGIAQFDPSQNVTRESALFLDDPNAPENLPYVNVVAVNKEDVDNPAWDILDEVYADERVRDAIEEEYHGNLVPVEIDREDLQKKLEELEEVARAEN